MKRFKLTPARIEALDNLGYFIPDIALSESNIVFYGLTSFFEDPSGMSAEEAFF